MNEKIEKIGIFSFSARSDCPVLWAHYANNHAGIVIIFDESRDDFLKTARPVIYSSSRPKTNVINVVDNMYSKWQSWAYEQEYRVLSSRGNALHLLADNSISGLIIGAKMSQNDRDSVCDCVAKRPDIEVFQAYIDDSDYAIRFSRA